MEVIMDESNWHQRHSSRFTWSHLHQRRIFWKLAEETRKVSYFNTRCRTTKEWLRSSWSSNSRVGWRTTIGTWTAWTSWNGFNIACWPLSSPFYQNNAMIFILNNAPYDLPSLKLHRFDWWNCIDLTDEILLTAETQHIQVQRNDMQTRFRSQSLPKT